MRRGKKILAVVMTLVMAVCMLCACGSKKPTSYEVYVTDSNGSPVSNVAIQFCSDTECMTGTTGEDGVAKFDREPGSYTIHVLNVPEGFASDSAEYSAPAEPDRVTIVLQ